MKYKHILDTAIGADKIDFHIPQIVAEKPVYIKLNWNQFLCSEYTG
jgi:hypothetical protein